MAPIEGFRLSPQQSHLWSLQQGGDGLPYRAQCAVLIEGSLNLPVLKTALRDVFSRHEILRTTFRCPQGFTIPLQVVDAESALTIEEYNLSAFDSLRQEAEIEPLFQKIGQVPFDLANGPVLRICLLTLDAARHLLIVNAPSLCVDATSIKLLVREISRSYAAFGQCRTPLGSPLQYADLAEWENELLEAEDAREGVKHWCEADASIAGSPKLPFDKRSFAGAAFEPRLVTSPLHPDLIAQIGKLVAKHDASISAFFLACWEILFSRLTGESDFVVGLVCDGRNYDELREALGPFAKTLPFQCRSEELLPFSELLKRIDASVRDAIQWQEYFVIDEFAQLKREPGENRFFPIAFELTDVEAEYTEGGIQISILKEYSCSDRFTLKLSCVKKGERLIANLHYDSSVFSAEDAGRIAQEFQTLLESACANPESSIAILDIMSPNELLRVLTEFNDA
ncbi:MAG: condensation domain-containing protein, partial [Candidatus Binataceae bacterium]